MVVSRQAETNRDQLEAIGLRVPGDVLPEMLIERLKHPLPGRLAQSRFEPELSFGRHYAPPPADARTAAVMMLLYPHNGEWHLPLTVRPNTMVDHAGQVSFPGGMIEPSETSNDAALRELEEELGISRDDVTLLGQLTPLYLFVSNFYVTPWVAVATERPHMTPDPREVAELLEVPLEHLLEPAHVSSEVREHGGLRFSAPHFIWGGHRVWGATSMMLSELLAVVEEISRPPQDGA